MAQWAVYYKALVPVRTYLSIQLGYWLQHHLVLIAQRKISVLATPDTSSNLRNQAPLFTELRLLQGTLIKVTFLNLF